MELREKVGFGETDGQLTDTALAASPATPTAAPGLQFSPSLPMWFIQPGWAEANVQTHQGAGNTAEPVRARVLLCPRPFPVR